MKKQLIIITILGLNLLSSGFLYAQNLTAPYASETLLTEYTNTSKQDFIYVFCAPQYLSDVDIELQAVSPYGNPYYFKWYKYDEESYRFIEKRSESLNTDTSRYAIGESGLYAVKFIDSLNHVSTLEKAWVFKNEPDIEIDSINQKEIEDFNLYGYFNADKEGNSQPFNFKYFEPDTSKFLISESTEIELCISAKHDTVSQLGFYLEFPDSNKRVELLPSISDWDLITETNSDTLNCSSFDQNCISVADLQDFCFSTEATVIPCMCDESGPVTGTYAITGDWSVLYGLDPANNGWQLSLFDCKTKADEDRGTLTDVYLKFKDSVNGTPVEYKYQAEGLNNAIEISSSCTSLYDTYDYKIPMFRIDTVTLENPFHYKWTSSPKLIIPDSTTSFEPLISPYPVLKTRFVLTVTDTFGCVFTDTANFEPVSSKLGLPTYCVPDREVYFKLEDPALIRQFNIKIFNRFGQLLYETDDPGFEWKGTRKDDKGMTLPSGTYFYIIQAVGWDNKTNYLDTSTSTGTGTDNTQQTTPTNTKKNKNTSIIQKGFVYLINE